MGGFVSRVTTNPRHQPHGFLISTHIRGEAPKKSCNFVASFVSTIPSLATGGLELLRS